MTMRLSNVLGRAVASDGGKVAIIDGDRRLTWSEFADRVARLGAALAELGVGPGDRVAILSENSHRYLEFYFGVPWAGGIFVPLNIRLTTADLTAILTHSGATVLLTDRVMLETATRLRANLPQVRHLILAADGPAPDGVLAYEQLLHAASPMAAVDRGGDDVAALFYTSGTSGQPKGVMLTHQNLVASSLIGVSSYSLHHRSVSLVPSPYFHVAAAAMIMPTLAVSGTVVVLPRFSAEAVLDALRRHDVTAAVLVNALMQVILSSDTSGAVAKDSFPHLETILMGASAMSDSLLGQVFDRFGDKRLINAYGMTEATAAITSISHLGANHETSLRAANAVGRPVIGIVAGIFDEDDRPLPRGQVGQIMIQGPTVMRGYWNNPELSAETLRGGWLHTGDAGYMDENGYVFMVDRLKDMIKTGGENVYSAEVERAIFNLPEVAQCAVVGLPDLRWGEMVAAVVVPKPGSALTAEAVTAQCRSVLAGYKCPRRVELWSGPLPANAAGKILKNVIREELGKASEIGRGNQVGGRSA